MSTRVQKKRPANWLRAEIHRDLLTRRQRISTSEGRVAFGAGIDAALDYLAAKEMLTHAPISEDEDV